MTTTFWMSFCDPNKPTGEQFLGVALVDADSLAEAVTLSHLHGCNPGGEIQTVELPHGSIPPEMRGPMAAAPRGTLLSRDDLERLGLMD